MKREERLKMAFDFLKSKGLAFTQKDISIKMGASKSNVSSAFAGVPSVLTDSFLSRFNNSYGGLFNENWLRSGDGEMLKEPTRTFQNGEINSINNAGTVAHTINQSSPTAPTQPETYQDTLATIVRIVESNQATTNYALEQLRALTEKVFNEVREQRIATQEQNSHTNELADRLLTLLEKSR